MPKTFISTNGETYNYGQEYIFISQSDNFGQFLMMGVFEEHRYGDRIKIVAPVSLSKRYENFLLEWNDTPRPLPHSHQHLRMPCYLTTTGLLNLQREVNMECGDTLRRSKSLNDVRTTTSYSKGFDIFQEATQETKRLMNYSTERGLYEA